MGSSGNEPRDVVPPPRKKAFGAAKDEIREHVIRLFLKGKTISQAAREAGGSIGFARKCIIAECEKADPRRIGYRTSGYSNSTGAPSFATEEEKYFWREAIKRAANPSSDRQSPAQGDAEP